MSIASPMIVPSVPAVILEPPVVFFTVHRHGDTAGSDRCKNPLSAQVIKEMDLLLAGTGARAVVCQTDSEAMSYGHSQAVAVFDYAFGSGEWSPISTDKFSARPHWTGEAPWGVVVKPACGARPARLRRCAAQATTLFSPRIFDARIQDEQFPWGMPKRGMGGPSEKVSIDPAAADKIIAALNSGPNLAEAIADRAFAAELPQGSKISWVRALTEPLGYSADAMGQVVRALREFERASHSLLKSDPEVQRIVLSGVALREPRLRDLYLDPGVDCFSIARPDLHWTQSGLSASENDEMPGGMPELVLLDLAYGINADKWKKFFDWLTSSGPLLFLVSHEWSKCYIPETSWLVSHLKGLGYDARMLTTDRLDELTVGTSGVIHAGERIGAIWRQFPIFETAGRLADIVELSRLGAVRLYPEWAHFGNKAWFYLFTRYEQWFADRLEPEALRILRGTLPDSHFIDGASSFPISVNGKTIGSSWELRELPEEQRNGLVMKICGANSLAARSYGVLMGKGIKGQDWSDWVAARMGAREPFLVQAMFNPGVVKVPVWHTKDRRGEMFRCKVLMRPWVLNGEVVSVHACAVPKQFHKVHGMVSMAVSPVRLV